MYPKKRSGNAPSHSTASTRAAAPTPAGAPTPAAAPTPAVGVTPSPSFPVIEESILRFWRDDDTFRASIAQRAEQGADEWVFYDGPPFANGLPHYGHLLTGYAKDLFPRYQTMRGKRVERRFGWDTHGLPAELEAERQLGITDKSQIEAMGIAAFNEAARSSVLHYTREWQDYVTRQARWVDFDNDYKTLDSSYMESVIWAFSTLWKKDLAYEGYRVLPYCWRDQTPLSNHELRMDDDVYKSRQDQTVTVTFPLVGPKAEALGLTGVKALAWTTTPWTLPTNLALAVGPDIRYAVVPAGPEGGADTRQAAAAPARADGGQAPTSDHDDFAAEYLLATELVGNYAKELGYPDAESARAAVSREVLGAELAGVSYDRLWDFYADTERFGTENAWRILADDYVSTDEGTGIVHQAPAYGEDDQRVCEANGIPVVISVDDGARFLPEVEPVAGMQVFDANRPLTQMLRAEGRLLRQASYEHSYPHCWRCRNPLIYKAVSSWFVRVTAFRDRMEELNQQITWVPENVKDGQFGKWLSGARDWSVSRNRYFGSPIPVWKSDDPAHPRIDVYGSLAELERDFGRLPTNGAGEVDLHRPYIDELTRPNPDDPSGRSTMRRIPDVLDVWFDSGSMPYAQVHYPFENRDWFDAHSPADYIVEYIGQTRGWFYLLHVLSTALFDRPAFRNVVSHGIVLGSDGQKMSKSLRNYPDVSEVLDRDGSDAMRWFLMSSSLLRGGNLVVTEEGIREGVRQFLLPVWSTYYFFTLYANVARDGAAYEARRRTDSTDVLDRYLLAKTHELVVAVTAHLDVFDSTLAAADLRDFADVLTNWYVRRSRDRFWAGVPGNSVDAGGAAYTETSDPDARDTAADNTAAFDTLFTVLETLARLAAPLAPLVMEEIWQGLTGERSVHLTDWPSAEEFPTDHELVAAMDRVRVISSAALALRKSAGLRVRLPLSVLTVVTENPDAVRPFEGILRDELNVKRVHIEAFAADSAEAHGITRKLTVNARAAGPRLGRDVQRVIAAARAGDWGESQGHVIVGGIELQQGEYDLVLETAGDRGASALALLPGGGFLLLDTAITPELEAEGLTRDVIRAVQETRRSAGFDVSDRIRLDILLFDQRDLNALQQPGDADLAGETLAVEVALVDASSNEVATQFGGELPSEWLRGALGHDVTFYTDYPGDRFANSGRFLVAVTRADGSVDV